MSSRRDPPAGRHVPRCGILPRYTGRAGPATADRRRSFTWPGLRTRRGHGLGRGSPGPPAIGRPRPLQPRSGRSMTGTARSEDRLRVGRHRGLRTRIPASLSAPGHHHAQCQALRPTGNCVRAIETALSRRSRRPACVHGGERAASPEATNRAAGRPFRRCHCAPVCAQPGRGRATEWRLAWRRVAVATTDACGGRHGVEGGKPAPS